MTKVIISIGDDGSSFFFDCENHSGDHDVCTIASTLCNVVVQRCMDMGYEIDEYKEGHVRISGDKCDEGTNMVMRTVLKVFEEVQRQNPDHLKVY